MTKVHPIDRKDTNVNETISIKDSDNKIDRTTTNEEHGKIS